MDEIVAEKAWRHKTNRSLKNLWYYDFEFANPECRDASLAFAERDNVLAECGARLFFDILRMRELGAE